MQEDGNVSCICRHRIERNAKNGFSPGPGPEHAELPDNIELRQCPAGVLAASDSGGARDCARRFPVAMSRLKHIMMRRTSRMAADFMYRYLG